MPDSMRKEVATSFPYLMARASVASVCVNGKKIILAKAN